MHTFLGKGELDSKLENPNRELKDICFTPIGSNTVPSIQN